MMIEIPHDKILYTDIDDTLVSWDFADGSAVNTVDIADPISGELITLRYNKVIVESIKAHRLRGHGVVAWSQGGASWATTVVKALGLQEYVNLTISKPTWIYDDLPSEYWMPKSMFKGECA